MVGGSTWRFNFIDNNQLLTAIFLKQKQKCYECKRTVDVKQHA